MTHGDSVFKILDAVEDCQAYVMYEYNTSIYWCQVIIFI